MAILVTGGLGYIGSHAYVSLAEAGYAPIIVDNLCNTNRDVAERLEQITGRATPLYIGNIRDGELLDRIFSENDITAVMHFAGLKSAPQSTEKPLEYYENNLIGSLSLFRAMEKHDCRTLIFSSSACVYGISGDKPIAEDAPLSPYNPYGQTKRMTEQILQDMAAADSRWSVMLLRYFNPVGAHPGGLIGENPTGAPGNLMPRIVRAAAGIDKFLPVTGTDYPTPDGSGVRDYLHVCDLAEGHVAALKYAEKHTGALALNLGSGKGISVLELIGAFESATGVRVPYKKMPRRPGDLAMYFADPTLAEKTLGWNAKRTKEEMCADSWRFAKKYLEEHKDEA